MFGENSDKSYAHLRNAYLYSEEELLTLVAGGNQHAFTKLFEKYQNKVYKTAYYYLQSHAFAEEIVQEVFIKIWQKRDTLQSVSYFNTWLLTLSKNFIIDQLRKKASEENALQQLTEHETATTENTADYKARQYQYQRLLQDAMNNLSSQQLHIYKMAREEGLTYEQIGAKLSLSPLTVKTHMSRALQSIRKFLQEHGEVYLLLLLMGK